MVSTDEGTETRFNAPVEVLETVCELTGGWSRQRWTARDGWRETCYHSLVYRVVPVSADGRTAMQLNVPAYVRGTTCTPSVSRVADMQGRIEDGGSGKQEGSEGGRSTYTALAPAYRGQAPNVIP